MGEGAIVPFGEEGIEDDGEGGFESGGDLTPGLVDPADDVYGGLQAGRSCGFAHQAHDGLQGVEQQALAGPTDVGEEAAFDGVVLGAGAGIGGPADFHADGVDQGLGPV